MAEALLLAILLHRDPALVSAVYTMGGLDAVVVVEHESQFHERAWRKEPEGTSYGLFQLYDLCHKQWREDVLLHIATGVGFLEKCKAQSGGNLARAYSRYNSGNERTSLAVGKRLERRRDSLALWLWRHLR